MARRGRQSRGGRQEGGTPTARPQSGRDQSAWRRRGLRPSTWRSSGALILLHLCAAGPLPHVGSSCRDHPSARCRPRPGLPCMRSDALGMRALRLRGGSSANAWAAICNADSQSDRERLEEGADGGEYLHDVDIEELIKDCKGESTWEKLQNYIAALQDAHGEDEVDNDDVDEYGPHLRCNNTWRIGPFAADCWSVPWEERKIVGELEFPNGNVYPLREGDLPNRRPFEPDDWPAPKPSAPKHSPAHPRLLRKENIDLREYDIAERDWLFKDDRGADKGPGEPRNETLKDLRSIPHWINDVDTEARRNMPPGGYPLEIEGAARRDFDPTRGDGEETSSTSHVYEYVRQKALELYGTRLLTTAYRPAIPYYNTLGSLLQHTRSAMSYSGIIASLLQHTRPGMSY